MATFFARPYARSASAISRTEKALGALILLLVAAILVTFGVTVATDETALFAADDAEYAAAASTAGGETRGADAQAGESAARPFPDAGVPGWRPPQHAERFTAENLFAKIDGGADAHLQHGFACLTFGSYVHEGDPQRTVDVFWYEMQQPAGAAAMYAAEKPPAASAAAIGESGYQVGGAVFFHEAASYVQVMPARADDADGQAALEIARRVAERIGAASGPARSRP